MTIGDVKEILEAEVLEGGDRMDEHVETACGSDLMSDVLAFVKDKTVLITGLINPHVVRTSEMLDITCIVFARERSRTRRFSRRRRKAGLRCWPQR